MDFPRLTTEFLREFITHHPEATVEEFIAAMRDKYKETICGRAEREVSAILAEFRTCVHKVLSESTTPGNEPAH